MPKTINVRVAAGRLIIQRATDDPKRKEGEFRRMDRTDEECKAAWKTALHGGAQPPDDGLYVVASVDGVSTLCGVTEHRDPATDLTDKETKAADEDSGAVENFQTEDESDREAVEQDSQDEMADAAEAKAARESDVPGPPNPPRGDRPDVA